MRIIGIFVLGAIAASFAASSAQAQTNTARKPNVVVILADDLGYSDIGCFGGEIRTPHLDQLAKDGLRFTNFFNTARCCPSRAALLTGLYPHQAGVGHMVENLGLPGYQGQLNRNCVTLAELLGSVGYRTYMVGKWHLSRANNLKQANDTWPRGRGFDRYYGILQGSASFFRPATLTEDDTPLETPKDGFYLTDAITDHGVSFVKDHRRTHPDRPLFMYVAYTAPHWPLHALKDDIDRYRGKYREGWDKLRTQRHQRMKDMGIVDAKWPVAASEVKAWDQKTDKEKDDLDLRMAIYAAQVDRMDQGIGRIVDTLKKEGILDDTLILFMADNGGCAEVIERGKGGELGGPDSFSSYGPGWAWLSNCMFRLFKHWTHGGGVSTPLIVHWPARIPQPERGKLRRQPGHLIDVMATCVEISGAKYPRESNGKAILPYEGKSLLPAFEDRPIEREAIYWEHEGNKAILRGDWKLVARWPGPWELYNLREDRGETADLVKQHPERVRELGQMWNEWAERAHVLPLHPYDKQSKKGKTVPAPQKIGPS